MSTAKIPAILVTALGMHVGVSPPTPAVPKGERKTDEGPLDVHVAGLIFKIAAWLHAAIELTIIVVPNWFPELDVAKQILDYLLPGGRGGSSRIFLSPTTCAATVMLMTGSAIRYQCYRELGCHFTFHVTVLKEHKLVTTGPYSIVRHPAYTGLALMFGGVFLWYFSQGSWLTERCLPFAGDMSTSTSAQVGSAGICFAGVVFVFSCFWAGVILLRVPEEDRILREHFREEWERWANRVRYRLIPGVY